MNPLMNPVLFQLGLAGDAWWSWIVWILFMMIFFMFYPRIMLHQIMWKLEKTAEDLEKLSDKSKGVIIKEITKNPTKAVKDSVDRFFEFFVISPVSLDPFGVVRKLDHIIQGQKRKFDYFVKQIAPKMDAEKQANIRMGFAGGITLHELAKIVRHYVELARKTKSYQIALILQMQLPLIENIAKSIYKGTQTLTKGRPIGDGLGPLVIADLIGDRRVVEIEEDILMAKLDINGIEAFVIKAKGPGGRLGRPGKAVEKIVRDNKISKIISIDAAAKMEGEKTGSLAEGVGVAMGGPGVERSYIENIAVKRDIPLDSIIVKMSQEEAIEPMKKAIKDSIKAVRESIDRSLADLKKGDKVVIAGIGNTSGVGNSGKSARDVEKWVDRHHRKMESKKKKKRGKSKD